MGFSNRSDERFGFFVLTFGLSAGLFLASTSSFRVRCLSGFSAIPLLLGAAIAPLSGFVGGEALEFALSASAF